MRTLFGTFGREDRGQMRTEDRRLLGFVIVGAGMLLSGVMGCLAPTPSAGPAQVGPVMPWPRPVPARVAPDSPDGVFVMTLGDVKTPLANATYDPEADRLVRADGAAIERYYADTLGVPFFSPIDKSVFPVPPSGWCSWYYYYQEITPEEVLANARWIARHLRPYGARYVQVDDGWQGVGHGLGENRDWTTIDARFRELGMDGLAAEIRKLGLEAGLWLAPHGQSNEEVARSSGAFLWKPDGTSASSTWEGTYLVDASVPQGLGYLADLFRRLRGWGYTYFKIDGQPIVLDEYVKKAEYLAGPLHADKEPALRSPLIYRESLRAIRGAIGPESYLLGCWGIPLAGVGIMNGSRTAGDVVPGYAGFIVAAKAIQRWNFLHNVAWYCDPDVFMVRPPLTEGLARAWATTQGLTGQALLTSDRLPDLPPSRIEMLRCIYPAVDVRPLDLFDPGDSLRPLWDLKVAHLGRTYDVVGVFNFTDCDHATRHVRWADLGLDPEQKYHVYDFWQGMYLGAWDHGVFVEVPPSDVRVLTLVPAADRPVLISTNRHITQGWVDLTSLESDSADGQAILRGTSRVIAGDPYVVTIGLPPGEPAQSVSARVEPRGAVKYWTLAHHGCATLSLWSDQTREVEWELRFRPQPAYQFPADGPGSVNVAATGLDSAEVTWATPYLEHVAFRVSVDDQILGYAFHPRAVLSALTPGRAYRVSVEAVWYDGSSVADKGGQVEYAHEVKEEVYLSDVRPEVTDQDWGTLRMDRSVDGNTLSVGGQAFERGLGTHANSRLVYGVHGGFRRFAAMVGLDDEAKPGAPVRACFEVWGDGRKLWESEPVATGEPARPVSVDITGVGRLELRVRSLEAIIDHLHADWLEARVLASESEPPAQP